MPAMTNLSLKRSGRRLKDHYDVIADGAVAGRIMCQPTAMTRPRRSQGVGSRDE
jgi:hypothetical protein